MKGPGLVAPTLEMANVVLGVCLLCARLYPSLCCGVSSLWRQCTDRKLQEPSLLYAVETRIRSGHRNTQWRQEYAVETGIRWVGLDVGAGD